MMCAGRRFILHSLICRVLLLLLLLLRNASDLRNCTSYFGACMWVWYCRPPIGAHFHPTPNRSPAIGGESAFTYCDSSFSQCDGYHVGISQRAGADAGPQAVGPQAGAGLRAAPACVPPRAGPHTRGLAVERRLVQATVRRSHSSC